MDCLAYSVSRYVGHEGMNIWFPDHAQLVEEERKIVVDPTFDPTLNRSFNRTLDRFFNVRDLSFRSFGTIATAAEDSGGAHSR